jgi:hypothetical protein
VLVGVRTSVRTSVRTYSIEEAEVDMILVVAAWALELDAAPPPWEVKRSRGR